MINSINYLINTNGPIICELIIDENQEPLFKQGYKKIKEGVLQPQNLEEMYPFIEIPISNTNN